MLELYRDAFKSLNDHEVKYLVIGGIAVGVHGWIRTTGDPDTTIEATEENARRLLAALDEARLYEAALTDVEGLLNHEITIIGGYVQVDVQANSPGIDFEEAWKRRFDAAYEGLTFPVVSREDLIRSMEAAGRQVHLDDLRGLRAQEGPP